jgi:hypothetical protein
MGYDTLEKGFAMRSDTFWRWHDWFWRAYDWGLRLGLGGWLVSAIGGGVIAAVFRYDGWDPAVMLLAALIAFAAVAVIYHGFCVFWDRYKPLSEHVSAVSTAKFEDADLKKWRRNGWSQSCRGEHFTCSGPRCSGLSCTTILERQMSM